MEVCDKEIKMTPKFINPKWKQKKVNKQLEKQIDSNFFQWKSMSNTKQPTQCNNGLAGGDF